MPLPALLLLGLSPLIAGPSQDPLVLAGIYLAKPGEHARVSSLDLLGDGSYSLAWLPDLEGLPAREQGVWSLRGSALEFRPRVVPEIVEPPLAGVLALPTEVGLRLTFLDAEVELVRMTPRTNLEAHLRGIEAYEETALGGPFFGGPLAWLDLQEDGSYKATICPPGAICLNTVGAGASKGRWELVGREVRFDPGSERPCYGTRLEDMVLRMRDAQLLREPDGLRLVTPQGIHELTSTKEDELRETHELIRELEARSSDPRALHGRYSAGGGNASQPSIVLELLPGGSFEARLAPGVDTDTLATRPEPQVAGRWSLADERVWLHVEREEPGPLPSLRGAWAWVGLGGLDLETRSVRFRLEAEHWPR